MQPVLTAYEILNRITDYSGYVVEPEHSYEKPMIYFPLDKEKEFIVIEELKNLKQGKKPNRNKLFRKAITPWTYRYLFNRIENKTQENRVRLVKVNPANTSRTCPICNKVSKENRNNESFTCISCGYSNDADVVGAINILNRFLFSHDRSVESLSLKK